jgi:hypothetical protein
LQSRRRARAIAIDSQLAPADAARRESSLAGTQVGPRVVLLDVNRVGAAREIGAADGKQRAEVADAGFPAIAVQRRSGWLPLFGEIASRAFEREAELATFGIERQPGAQIHAARQTAFDLLGRRVFVDVDTREQFRRNVLEAERAAVLRGERGVTVELAAHPAQASNRDSRAFDGDAVGIARRRNAADCEAGDSLQHFRDAAIRQRTDVVRGDRVDHLGRFLLARLRGFELPADTRDDDGIHLRRFG